MRSRRVMGVIGVLVICGAIVAGVLGDHGWRSRSSISNDPILEQESRKSFDFFWKEANADASSPGYGLIRDRAPGNSGIASVASVGFGLTALVIGADRQWITQDEAKARAVGTLNTMLGHADQEHGFFYHFLDMSTAKRAWNSEVSVIDTTLALNGALTAGEYFGGEIKEKAERLYERVDWNWYRDPERNQFHMAYSPENGFGGWWDFYAEQLSMYILAAGSPTHPADPEMFYSFKRDKRAYKDGPAFIHSWFGSIFTYQFSHAWVDFRGKQDREGVDWWQNSVDASRASRAFGIDMAATYKTFGPNGWGVTASDSPTGYNGLFGAPPSGTDDAQHKVDGTLAPAGAAGSIVFTPEKSIAAMRHFKNDVPGLWGTYGFADAYNQDVAPTWVAPDVIGIDKGISLLMIENYRSGLVWKTFMKNPYVQQGMKKVGFTDKQ